MVAVSTVAAERRRAVRFRPAFGTYCYCLAGGEGLVWDVSATGLGMLIATPPGPGTTIPVEVTNGAESLVLWAHVAHTRRLAAGDYFVGLKFDRPLAPGELEPFVTPGRAFD